ncbi:hypothetical protein BJP37_10455 [Moorena bouillonii PNG]|uniref:Uncharacterized protein n=1 Tax=Moorena bouillonii PNG TaxID=568701 RepID=A0A1U7N0C2_9CYAN|nr:hypothetical protein BJP37_10455 [Moorena bouillonii PNG]
MITTPLNGYDNSLSTIRASAASQNLSEIREKFDQALEGIYLQERSAYCFHSIFCDCNKIIDLDDLLFLELCCKYNC